MRRLTQAQSRRWSGISGTVAPQVNHQFPPGTICKSLTSLWSTPTTLSFQGLLSPSRQLVLMGTQLDSVPPASADPVSSTVLGSHSDDPVADGTSESEPEQALPIHPRNNRGFTRDRHLDEFTLVDVFKRRAHIMRQQSVLHVRKLSQEMRRRTCPDWSALGNSSCSSRECCSRNRGEVVSSPGRRRRPDWRCSQQVSGTS